jgi:hypothetical protein
MEKTYTPITIRGLQDYCFGAGTGLSLLGKAVIGGSVFLFLLPFVLAAKLFMALFNQ